MLVVAEMPGVDAEDVQVRIEGDVLELAAETAGKRYGKELVLPREPRDPKVTTSARNGVVEIRIEDAASGAGANDEQLDDAA
ncbi:MAG TPA: Hsp20/alpha crystallin family protein [Sandaracinaceae bacterium LLY-WYZ-13_1]|nr:Hsp20/alpha crystallin family protein [Sandaracinaceae bacterium LLY-WYZ-13_1]